MIAKKILLIISLILFLFLSKKVVFFFNKEKEINIEKKLYPNIFINQINFGEKKEKEVVNFFEEKNKKLKEKTLTVFYQNENIATFSGLLLNLHFDSQGIWQRAFLIGRSRNFPSKIFQKITAIFNLKRFEIEFKPSFDYQPISDFLKIAKERYEKPAKNALFKFENGKVVAFYKEEWGQKINEEKFIVSLNQTIQKMTKDKKKDFFIYLPLEKIEPEIKLSYINKFGIKEEIGVGKSDFTGSISSRIHNIILAASKFNGILIPPGKVLSFNETVGDISFLSGYQPAYIIKDGKTLLGDGGGVCQVSTTLFRAALNAGLPILERHSHAYRVSYYENDSPPGFDATVFAPFVDLKIKNDTKAHILIQTKIDKENNLLFFYLFGQKDGRKIEIEKPKIWDIVPPLPPKYQDDPTLKKGVIKQIDFPSWGAKANFHYKVVKDGEVLFEKDFFSSYRPWQAVYLVGTAE